MLTFCQISFLFNFNFFLIILAINFAINYYQLISVMLRPQVFFTKSWKQQERFIPLLNFYELILYTLYIYIYYMWKNWNKGCIFYFFKFSRMLCWRKKKDEIFSGRLMMIIMPIITDLLKKMFFFFNNLVPCECTLLSLSHCDQKEKYSNKSKYIFLYFCVTRKQPVEG